MRSFFDLGQLTWKVLARRTWQRSSKDNISQRSAELAFYFIFSLFPLLVVLIALLGLCFRFHLTPILLQTLHQYLSEIAPRSASRLIDSTLQEIIQGAGGGKLSLALLMAVWSASQGMQALIRALNAAYETTETRSWLQQHWLVLKLTLASAFLVGAVLLILMVGQLLIESIPQDLGFGLWVVVLWNFFKIVSLLGLVLTIFNMWYFYGPNVGCRKWHWLMPGTLLAIGMWVMVSLAFKLYLAFFDHYTMAYGSLGAVIILLWWVYLTNFAILIGAEVNSVIERQS